MRKRIHVETRTVSKEGSRSSRLKLRSAEYDIMRERVHEEAITTYEEGVENQ